MLVNNELQFEGIMRDSTETEQVANEEKDQSSELHVRITAEGSADDGGTNQSFLGFSVSFFDFAAFLARTIATNFLLTNVSRSGTAAGFGLFTTGRRCEAFLGSVMGYPAFERSCFWFAFLSILGASCRKIGRRSYHWGLPPKREKL